MRMLAAANTLERIKPLYRIEAEIRGQSAERRRQVRQAKARPLMDDFRTWLEDKRDRLDPRSDTAKAIAYALNRWTALTRYLDDGRLEIDNSAAERAMRAVAIGRNYVQSLLMRSPRLAPLVSSVPTGDFRLVGCA